MICWAVMLVPCPRTTHYIDPEWTSREPGHSTSLHPDFRHLPLCGAVAADGSQGPPDEREAGAASLHFALLPMRPTMDLCGSVRLQSCPDSIHLHLSAMGPFATHAGHASRTALALHLEPCLPVWVTVL